MPTNKNKKYDVLVTHVMMKRIEVEANSPEEAEDKAQELYHEEDSKGEFWDAADSFDRVSFEVDMPGEDSNE